MKPLSKKSRIHGFVIPQTISQFLDSETDAILKKEVLNRAFGVSLEMDVKCNHYSLEFETLGLRRIQNDLLASVYGLKKGSTRDSKFLDAEKSLCLGVNQDEEGICLDYRGDSDSPAVILSSSGDQADDSIKWFVVAKTFESFLTKYKNAEQGVAPNP